MSKDLRILWDNINSGNYKQAQVKINKELKKQPTNGYYLSLSALLQNKLGKTDQAVDQCRKIAATGPSNIAILSILSTVYESLGMVDECSKLFETANAKDDKNEQIIDTWLSLVAENSYIRGLQKATMAQQKLTKSRNDQFAAVLCMSLAVKEPTIDSGAKKLLPMLGQRIVQNLEPITSPQEAYVKAVALEMMESSDQLVEYLQGQNWGCLDLEVMLVEVLNRTEQWDKLYALSAEKITSGTNNYLYHSHLVKAAKQLGGKVDEVEKLLTEGESRNGELARVELHRDLASIQRYFARFGTKRAAYTDLHPFVTTALDKETACEWLDEEKQKVPDCKTLGSVTALVNLAKFKSDLGCPNTDNVMLYKKSEHLLAGKDEKDYHSACDFLLIEATRLANSGEEYKAVVLLEHAAKADKHNFYVRTMLVQLYIKLGAYKSAAGHYQSLSIKSMQDETLSYLLDERAVSLSPASFDAKSDLDGETGQIGAYVKVALKRGAFTQVGGFLDLQTKLVDSVVKKMASIDLIKCVRLGKNDPATSSMEDCLPELLHDNRDRQSLWADFSVQPVPNQTWVHTMTLREQIIRRLVHSDGLKDKLDAFTAKIDTDQFTFAEKWSCEVVLKLGHSALNKTSASGYLVLGEAPILSETPDWASFHAMFTTLETCKVVLGYITRLKGARHQVKFDSSAVDQLHQDVIKLVAQTKDHAEKMKQTRAKRYRQVVDQLTPWMEEQLPGTAMLVESVVDYIHQSHDTQLTAVKTVSA